MTRYELSDEANQAINGWISQIIECTTSPRDNELSDCTTVPRDNQNSEPSIPILSYEPQPHQLAALEREILKERLLRKEYLEDLENKASDDNGEEEPSTSAVKKKGRKRKGKKGKGKDETSCMTQQLSSTTRSRLNSS